MCQISKQLEIAVTKIWWPAQ
uniref:Uncharacterized protein n=1 Tax=Rhizophora mucronata TaxID=61149 RepID=A0A2P2PR04_RHIMU